MKLQSPRPGAAKFIFCCGCAVFGTAVGTTGSAAAQDFGLGKHPAMGLPGSPAHRGLPGAGSQASFRMPGLSISTGGGTHAGSGTGLSGAGHGDTTYPRARPGLQSNPLGQAGSTAQQSGGKKTNTFASKLRKKMAAAMAAAPSTPSRYDYSYGAAQIGTDSKSLYGAHWKNPEDGYEWGARPDR